MKDNFERFVFKEMDYIYNLIIKMMFYKEIEIEIIKG